MAGALLHQVSREATRREERSAFPEDDPGARPCAQPRERTLIVGITGDGYVPVVEDPAVDDLDVLVGVRSVISLPAVVLGPPGRGRGDARDRALEQLRREFGYEGDELVPMETSTPPGFLLAPLLRSSGWRERIGFVPGVYEVPLHRISQWLRHRRLAGAVESQQPAARPRARAKVLPALGAPASVPRDRRDRSAVRQGMPLTDRDA